MKHITLHDGTLAQVDDADYGALSRYRWYRLPTGYACRYEKRDGTQRPVLMHRQILGIVDPQVCVDHRDLDTLNNQRSNLRPATKTQNAQNARPKGGASAYKGVCWCRHSQRWVARIRVDGKRVTLGYFRDEVVAAQAYDAAAMRYHGEFARVNFGGKP